MGSRGASSGSKKGLSTNFKVSTQSGQWNSQLDLATFQTLGDYTDDNNPNLVKYQGQEDDKLARFLSKVDNETDLLQVQTGTNDPWPFYDNPMQKLLQQLKITKGATVLSEAEFNKYVSKTGSTVLYRGWSSQNAIDRFKKSPNNHIGTGINGDGYYLAPDRAVAVRYGGYGTKMALSPKARVISADAVKTATQNLSPTLRRSLSKTDSSGTRSFGGNGGMAQVALKMGYNVIDAGWAVIPLTRDAVVISDKNAW